MNKILIIILIIGNLLNANMEDFANSVIEVREKEGSIKLEDRVVLYGGGYTLKTPNITLTPFTVIPPKINSGCGGIDMVFGSLGFLNKEHFIKFAEGIMASAPGVAFDLALKTLCPSCAETIKALESMANQINNMSLNSCSAATNLGNKALDSIVSQGTNEDLKNGTFNSYFEGLNENYINPASKQLNKINSWMNNFSKGLKGDSPKIITYMLQDEKRSFMEYFFKSKQYYTDDIMISFLKSTIGDIQIASIAQGESPTIWSYYNSLSPLKSYYIANNKQITNSEKLINRLMGVDNNNQGVVYNNGYSLEATNIGNFPLGTLVNTFKDKTQNLINKIINRQELVSKDIVFLGYFNFPVYKVFNILGGNAYTSEILVQSKDKLASMLASQLIYELIISVSRELQLRLSELDVYSYKMRSIPIANAIPDESGNSLLKKVLVNMAAESRLVASLAYEVYTKNYNDFIGNLSNKNELVQKAKEIKQSVLIKANPNMLEKMIYMQSLAPGRLK